MTKAKRATEAETVLAKTTIQYTAPYVVENSPPEIDFDDADDFEAESVEETIDESEMEQEAASPNDFIGQLKAVGVVPESGWALKVEKFPPESLESGPKAFKLPCNRFVFTPSELLAKKHLEKVKMFGPGRYWLTLRAPNAGAISAQWELNIDADNNEQVISPISSQAPPAIPSNFLQAVQAPAPPVPHDPFDEIDKTLRLIERLEKLRSRDNPPAPSEPQGELALAAYLIKQPQISKQITANLIGSQSDSIWPLLFQNLDSIGQMVQGIVGSVFNNIQAAQSVGNPAPSAARFMPPVRSQPVAPKMDSTAELTRLLMPVLTADAAALQIAKAEYVAADIIQLSDYADANQLEPIAHYVEMLARFGPEETTSMLSMLAKQPLILADYHKTWLIELKSELAKYYEPEESAEPANAASES